jgi:hypothetical protein
MIVVMFYDFLPVSYLLTVSRDSSYLCIVRVYTDSGKDFETLTINNQIRPLILHIHKL